MENVDKPDLNPALVSDETKQAEPIAPEGTAPPEDQTKEQAPEKTFTQTELDALIQKRLLKEERRVHRRIEQQLREEAQTRQAQVEPKRETFADDQAYIRAQIEHQAELRAATLIEQREKEREGLKLRETFEERAEKAVEKYPDFDEVARNPQLPINPMMAEYISLAEDGADIAYHLGKNPTLAARISRLSPGAAAYELARISSELSTKPKARPSNAPEPITPVGNRGRASTSSLPSDDDDVETWMKKERARTNTRR